MKHIVCNFCGQDDTDPVNHGSDLLLNKQGNFYLVRCHHCGLIYQNPQLSITDLAAHYPDDYLPYQSSAVDRDLRSQQVLRNRGIIRFCDRIIRHHPEVGRLLDVGCSTGSFLYAMRNRGWQVQGVEPVAYAAEQARQDFGLEIYTGVLETAVYPDSSFDVVTLWDVLEHVPDPKATLAETARILKPGGLLVFSLPNPDCVEAHLFGGNWVGWERPRHLHLIPLPLINSYLELVGLQMKAVESFNGRLSLTLLSLEFALKARGIRESKWRPWLRFIYNPIIRALVWPVYKLGEKLNKTTNMTVFAKRPFSH